MNNAQCKKVLGIETSCDETGISLIETKGGDTAVTVVKEVIHSQIDLHADYGGVVPELAAREHLKNLPLLTDSVLSDAGIGVGELDLIAVTVGPGLKGCLLSGMLFASGLAASHNVPVYGVNHIEAHVLSVLLENPELQFPFLTLVVSGGHTELHLVTAVGEYALLARTIDDAAGEAFDKSAKLLGLPYPGGPTLSKLGDSFTETPTFDGTSRFSLPRVMLKQPGFSFSGLKTAISLMIAAEQKDDTSMETPLVSELAWTIQESIVELLIRKVRRAVKETQCKTLAVCGGVSANRRLREALDSEEGLSCHFPSMRHCVDNGTMIALTAHLRHSAGLPSAPFEAKPRWPIETSKHEGGV